jgi:hypothetical protein
MAFYVGALWAISIQFVFSYKDQNLANTCKGSCPCVHPIEHHSLSCNVLIIVFIASIIDPSS